MRTAALTDGARLTMLSKLRSNALLTGSAVYLASNILFAAIPLALLPVLTRYLTPAEYGEVGMFQTLLGALSAVVGLNVVGAAGRKYYDRHVDRKELREFIGACLQILAASALVVLVLAFFWREPLGTHLGLGEQWVLWAVFVAAATVVVNLRLGQWQVEKKAGRYGAMQVSQSVANLLLSIVFVVMLHQGADGRLAAQAWTAGAFLLLALWLLRHDGLLAVTPWNRAHVAEALRFGVPLVPHVAGIFLLSAVDRIVINGQLGLQEVGVYIVAAQLAAGLTMIFDAANKAYVPWLFERLKHDDAGEKRQIVRVTYWSFALCLLPALALWLLGPWIVRILAGPAYAEASAVIGWLALGQAFGGMYLLVANYIFFSKRTGLLSGVSLLSGAVNLALLVCLLQPLGLQGAGIAFAAAMGLRFLLTWRVAHLRHPMPWLRLRT